MGKFMLDYPDIQNSYCGKQVTIVKNWCEPTKTNSVEDSPSKDATKQPVNKQSYVPNTEGTPLDKNQALTSSGLKNKNNNCTIDVNLAGIISRKETAEITDVIKKLHGQGLDVSLTTIKR